MIEIIREMAVNPLGFALAFLLMVGSLFGLVAGIIAVLHHFRARATRDGITFEDTVKASVEKELLKDRVLRALIEDIDRLKFRDILAEMMGVVVRYTDKSIFKMREVYLGMVTRVVGDAEAHTHEAVRRYETITDVVRMRLVERMKLLVQDDKLYQLPDKEFYQFSMDELKSIYGYTENLIDYGYHHTIIGIEELRNKQREYAQEYGELLFSLLVECRAIKLKGMEKISELESKYHEVRRHWRDTGEVLELTP